MNKLVTLSLAALALLYSLSSQALMLTNTYLLDNALSDSSSNFHPQGLGYDTGSNELLFMQQSSKTIHRTDLMGNITGSLTVGTFTYHPNGFTTNGPNHTTSIAGDGTNYYFSDYTNNSGGYDLYSVDKSGGTATNFSTETPAYGGYPIDVRDGNLYRTNTSSSYNYSNLNQIRISSLSDPDNFTSLVSLVGVQGIGDIAVDSATNTVYTIDYLSSATIRQFDLSTGNQVDSWALSLDGLDSGITFADGNLYYYDWNSGSGSTLSVFATAVPGPASILFVLAGLMVLLVKRQV